MSVGLYSGVSGLALGTGLYKGVSGLWGGASGLDNNFGGAALNLNFLSGALDSRITFTRSTTATFTGSNGLIQLAAINEPRFDYDPVTLAAKGLLIEEQRTNLVVRSEEFDNASWTKNNVSVTANSTTSPSGLSDADLVIPNTTGGVAHSIYTSFTASAIAYSLSFYAKQAGYTGARVANTATGAGAGFDLANGVVFGTPSAGVTASIQSVGNGWYRCSITFTATAGLLLPGVYVQQTPGTTVYAGDGTSGIYVWGAQLEAGSFATSYIPTVASQVTRTADVATMTGTNFSNWYNQTEGTLLCEFDTTTLNASGTTTYTAAAVSDGTNSNLNALYVYNNLVGGQVRTGNVNQADINAGGSPANNTTIKAVMAYATNDIAVTANGTVVKADTSATINTTMTQMGIGTRTLGNPINGHIRSIQYYNTRLPNATLQALTA